MFIYDAVEQTDPEIYQAIKAEEERQTHEIELIASENYASKAVIQTMASVLTNKYSEGYIGKRYYAGQVNIDTVEGLAISRAKEIFGAEHVNVQPLSGSPANTAVYLAMLEHGDTILGMNLSHGGHLSHGHPINFSGKYFNVIQYGVKESDFQIDMEEVRALAIEHKPKMIIAGFSAYTRTIDWAKFREIADEVGALLMADIAHIAGLIAGKQLENPVPYCDIVTTTTHKTLRGPRGAMIMCKKAYAKKINRAVFPGLQGGPHDHIMAAKAVAFKEALSPDFIEYSKQVITNAQLLASELQTAGLEILTGGTDNHIILVDTFASRGVTGNVAEEILEKAGISCNKNMLPFDPGTPMKPSGIRLGTPAITTRGFKEAEVKELAKIISLVIREDVTEAELAEQKSRVRKLCLNFPIPGLD